MIEMFGPLGCFIHQVGINEEEKNLFFNEFFHFSYFFCFFFIRNRNALSNFSSNFVVLYFTVIRCRDLVRSNGGQVNAYVKVAVLPDTTTANENVNFQRTAVHRNSHRPFFDHRFTFDLNGNECGRIQLAVWHRDRECK